MKILLCIGGIRVGIRRGNIGGVGRGVGAEREREIGIGIREGRRIGKKSGRGGWKEERERW